MAVVLSAIMGTNIGSRPIGLKLRDKYFQAQLELRLFFLFSCMKSDIHFDF